MSLKAGTLRHRIQIQERVTSQDPATGEQVLSWSTRWDKVPAAINPLSVREFIAAQKEGSEVSAKIVIRYRSGVNASMRILHGGRVYNIAGSLADADSGLEYLTLPVTEGVNEG